MRNIFANAPSLGEIGEGYSPQHIANFFLAKAEEEDRPLTPLKLIKLVYIAYGWILALLGRRLFDEQIEAWRHGPVIPSVYHEFKHFGGGVVTDNAVSYDLDTGTCVKPIIPVGDSDTIEILDKVWSAYRRFSGWALRQKTHQVGTPWQQVYDPCVMNKPIPDGAIKLHFQDKIREILDTAGG